MPSGRQASLTKEKVTFGTDVKKLGFDVFWEAELPSITTVKPGSEGESRGVLPGDIIAAVNGLDTKGKKKEELLPLLKARPLELLLQREKHTEVEDEGSSSDDDEERAPRKPTTQSRCKEDLALLAGHAAVSSSRPRAAAGVTAVKGAPLKENRRKEKQEEMTGEDSAEEEQIAPASEAVAKRFDADMGLLHQQRRQLVKASYVTGREAAAEQQPGASGSVPSAAAADRTRKDSESASRLQAERDAEATKEKAPLAAADEEATAQTRQAESNAAASIQRAKEEEEVVKLEDLEGRSYEQEASMPLQKLLDVRKAEVKAEAEQEAQEELVELGLEDGAAATEEDAIDSYDPFTLQVIVPPDAEPGSLITVQAPNGLLVQAAVPNVPPGSLLYIHVNPPGDAAPEGQHSPVESGGGSPHSDPIDQQDGAKGVRQLDERVSPSQRGDGAAAAEEVEAGGAVAVGVPNLISAELESRELLDVWESRIRRLSTVGMTCSKVGRSGKIYRRTFWTSGGCLRMNGRFASAVPLTSFQAVYKDTCSADFEKLASAKDTGSGTSFLRRSPKSNGVLHKELCCVLVAQDRVFSLIFEDMKERDDFAETVAWCIQQMRAPGPS